MCSALCSQTSCYIQVPGWTRCPLKGCNGKGNYQVAQWAGLALWLSGYSPVFSFITQPFSLHFELGAFLTTFMVVSLQQAA